MVILAFLQNMWFKDPERAREVFAAHLDRRNDLIRIYLFMGCLTGRRLEQVFGEELCQEIIWEECSPDIGGRSSAAFPADVNHMYSAILKHDPKVILAFGVIAEGALRRIMPGRQVIYGPHPAARNGAIHGLEKMREELRAATQT